MTTIFNRSVPTRSSARWPRRHGNGFLARDTRTGSEVALKLVPHGTDREARDILEAEQWGAELQKQFSGISRHVPAVHEHRLDESGYFLVAMEYLDGENLSEVITRGRLQPDHAVDVAVELCVFLECAHRFEAIISDRKLRSLVHGDLKPRNVRISRPAGEVLDSASRGVVAEPQVTRNDSHHAVPLAGATRHWWKGTSAPTLGVGSCSTKCSWNRSLLAQDTRRLEQLILARCPPPPPRRRFSGRFTAIVAKLLAALPPDDMTARNRFATIWSASGLETLRRPNRGRPGHPADEPPVGRTRL